jgi:NitT/TauT family transport system ATP-binding protein
MNQLNVNIKLKQYQHHGDKNSFNVIQNLQFEQQSDQFICLVGPSGCGKTTLLNIIGGLDSDYEGDIQIDKKIENTNASFVFQTPRLLPWRTVLENIQLANETNLSPDTIEQLLLELGLKNSLNSYPHHLSLGMQRRVALARAFSVNSDLLLMDEPFVSLDQPTARKARQLLLKLWQTQPKTLIFVTHDIEEAIQLADRILFLSESPSTIIDDIAIKAPRSERTPEHINSFRNQLRTKHQHLAHLL